VPALKPAGRQKAVDPFPKICPTSLLWQWQHRKFYPEGFPLLKKLFLCYDKFSMIVDHKDYFKAVTLGAFSFRDTMKLSTFVTLVQKIPVLFSLLHLVLVSLALNFPLMLNIARLSPYEVYTRLYGEQFSLLLEEELQIALPDNPEDLDEALKEDFNQYMYQSGYTKTIMLPLTGMVFILLLIIQAVFYTLAAFFMGLQRMTQDFMSFSCRLSFLVFSSTFPVFLAAIFGLWMPTVHIIVFYLAVIIISFQRSAVCRNG
jgi:hypothetical protein